MCFDRANQSPFLAQVRLMETLWACCSYHWCKSGVSWLKSVDLLWCKTGLTEIRIRPSELKHVPMWQLPVPGSLRVIHFMKLIFNCLLARQTELILVSLLISAEYDTALNLECIVTFYEYKVTASTPPPKWIKQLLHNVITVTKWGNT